MARLPNWHDGDAGGATVSRVGPHPAASPPPLTEVSLDDRYTRTSGPILLSGIQALVRLPLVQSVSDREAGLSTAGFISGYRGSPLAGLDQQLWRAGEQLERHHVRFQPGLNEELAATAVWGSQQVGAFRGAIYDGVFAMWYGKAPGVDRSGDTLRHGNMGGSARHGGVLVVAGDDHACKSSSLPSQSEYFFMDLGMPVLNPSGVQEVLDYGLIGWELSRYSGCWIAMIALADTMDSTASVDADIHRVRIQLPTDFALPAEGLNFTLGTPPLAQEGSLHRHRLYAAIAFARANGLDRTVIDNPGARLGIVTTGKAYLDVLEALEDLGIGEREAAAIGLRLYKVGMSWPLDKHGIVEFAAGLEEILVVEEKRGLIENQIKEQLYNAPGNERPRVVGKFDEHGRWLLPSMGDLSPGVIARAIAGRIPERLHTPRMRERLEELQAGERALAAADGLLARRPFYCSGCPHNLSTKVPEGSRGLGGIGCHFMVQWMERDTDTICQMGGEGVQWIGQSSFTDQEHVFANLGDGTYFHSGILAIRAAVAAGVNITYKLLYNDAVAMTGGQPVDGTLTVPRITRQLDAEGVGRIAVVTDEPEKYGRGAGLAPDTTVHHRRELDFVQRRFRETEGCTVIVYDQTCAAELRRRRKRGHAPDPPVRAFINEAVCEGCGDCSEQSNCVSIEPIETELGRKRTINQSSCNKDFSCVEGLCPSFVTIRGGRLRRPSGNGDLLDELARGLPEPTLPSPEDPWNVVVTGIGGTGVVTVGALLAMAAHLEGKAATVLDMTGLAQKGGAVISHVRIARSSSHIHTPRVPTAKADALLACDLVVAASRDSVVKLDDERSRAIVNSHLTPTADFVLDNDVEYDGDEYLGLIERLASEVEAIDATSLATRLLGDAVAANTFMLGYAFQRGLLPLGRKAIERAIELNAVAVEANKKAFTWGRLAAHDRRAAEQAAGMPAMRAQPARSLEEIVVRREAELTAYQNEALARRYRSLIDEARAAERRIAPESTRLAEAVVHNYFKVLAYKDEYEVSRLYMNGDFVRKLDEQFEGDFRVELQLAPPLFQRTDPKTGRPRKHAYGPWMLSAMRVLARMKFLRGTPLDPFGYTKDRRLERRIVREYEETVRLLLVAVDADNLDLAIEIASLPEKIRGFGIVKRQSYERAKGRESELLESFRQSLPARP